MPHAEADENKNIKRFEDIFRLQKCPVTRQHQVSEKE